MKPPRCPSQDELRAFVSALIDDARAAFISSHLESCESCLMKLDEIHGAERRESTSLHSPPGEAETRVANRGLLHSSDANLKAVSRNLKIPHASSAWTNRSRSLLPEGSRVARYRVVRVLGKGGFGVVYLMHDEDLKREVAVKIPHADIVGSVVDARAYLEEAQLTAGLDHPSIVPVYDIGATPEIPFYVVSKYVEGIDLAGYLQKSTMDWELAVSVAAHIADALHYAHESGIVHRDIKPRNILMGVDRVPHLLDFGLALRERDIGRGGQYAGTPAYMSPEQVRGEGHRVDRRSDLFSLGIVLYEMLSGQKPFKSDSIAAIQRAILEDAPDSFASIALDVPPEVDRICQKALSKRVVDRYATAAELRDDLRDVIAAAKDRSRAGTGGWSKVVARPSPGNPLSISNDNPDEDVDSEIGQQDGASTVVVPRGLRAFDEDDADFFLKLLPGPFDRSGLPSTLRFWKSRIEAHDSAVRVGVIYGPSGCGKSSLVKAGLMPVLGSQIIAILVESTDDLTEKTLLQCLQARIPALDADWNLTDSLKALRQGYGVPVGHKVLIVLDQFEQWLHANQAEQSEELMHALRQCDGSHVQCLITLRDDFFLAMSRFFHELEIVPREGENLTLVDLFECDHARRVLMLFGQAYGRLPGKESELTNANLRFLEQAVDGLANDGRIVCARLALFAQMMQSKPWEPQSLKDMGGMTGIGFRFLEEAFGDRAAAIELRNFQYPARQVLASLLPESGADIKGHSRSYEELRLISQLDHDSRRFDELIRILDMQLRLITPQGEGVRANANQPTHDPAPSTNQRDAAAQPSETDTEGDGVERLAAFERRYQLSHDSLVHSVRDWVSAKQKETRRGRAELLLAECTTSWNRKRTSRSLPSWWGHAWIRVLTDRSLWTLDERRMMRASGHHHGFRTLVVSCTLAILVFITVAGYRQMRESRNVAEASRIVEGLLAASTSQFKSQSQQVEQYRQWAREDLLAAYSQEADESNAKLHAAMALLQDTPEVRGYLDERLLMLPFDQATVLADVLSENPAPTVIHLENMLADDAVPDELRFRAHCGLSSLRVRSEHWDENRDSKLVAAQLVSCRPSQLRHCARMLDFRKDDLVATLTSTFGNPDASEQARSFATICLAEFCRDDPQALFDLLLDADPQFFAPLLDALREHRTLIVSQAESMASQSIAMNLDWRQRDQLAARQANAAVLLLAWGEPEKVWDLMQHRLDPSVRSYIIHRMRPAGVDPAVLITRFELESDISRKRALLLALGEYEYSQLPADQVQSFVESVVEVFVNDPDPGLHGAADWLLRNWRVELPQVPAGFPELSEKQRAERNRDIAEVRRLEDAILNAESDHPTRFATWIDSLSASVGNRVSMDEQLIAHFSFDEGEGQSSRNHVRNAGKAKYSGPPTFRWVPGVIGAGVELPGDGGSFSCDLPLLLRKANAFSISCWFHPTALSSFEGTLLSQFDHASDRGFAIRLNHNTAELICEWRGGNDSSSLDLRAQVDELYGRWHQLVLTNDGTENAEGVRLYIDGRPVPLGTRLAGTPRSFDWELPLQIGMRGTQNAFKGMIDEVGVYHRLLTPDEARQVFERDVVSMAEAMTGSTRVGSDGRLQQLFQKHDAPVLALQTELQEARHELAESLRRNGRRWYVNGQGQTYALLVAEDEWISHAESDLEDPFNEFGWNRHLDRQLAVATREVTRRDWLAFVTDQDNVFRRGRAALDQSGASLSDTVLDLPIMGISWYEAVSYCNWLSEQEGIPPEQWCYHPNADGQYWHEMRTRDNFLELEGYRLPTEAEWEFACRSRTVTIRYYGSTPTLLQHYAWFNDNCGSERRTVGLLKPNDFGLFDTLGNAAEWNYDSIAEWNPLGSYAFENDRHASGPIRAGERRPVRGARSTHRVYETEVRATGGEFYGLPNYKTLYGGFRPVRTIPASPSGR